LIDRTRFARHVALGEVGAEGQAKLEAARMLVVGLGGLGCPAAQYLATSGVGALVLNDFDRVDLSNLPRQVLFGETDVGSLKVEAAAAALRRLRSEIETECLPERLDDDALTAAAASVDIVLDCTDNFATRLGINRACVATGKPLVSGAALRFEGQITVFGGGPNDPCYRCVYSEEDELLGDCAGNGVLAPVPGVIGTLMAVEAMKIAILGQSALAGALLLWDALSGAWQSIDLAKDPDCPVCGV
jgi:molybdopterin/thiamine biosynthesis adenylyltransferase